MADQEVDRAEIAADLERARRSLHELLDSASPQDFDRRSNGTRWTNEQLLFHMVFGYMVVRRLLVLVRILSRLPDRIGRRFAQALDAATPVFHEINYLGSCAAATVFNRHRMGRQCDRVIARLQRSLARESETDLQRSMDFPVRWDPFFTESMTLEQVYRYPGKHFDFHRAQLTLG
ncbi:MULTISPECIES: DinB family protein [unclassified Rhodococcus (in: high G+C Gram-positive bacteria)]|uniref:DinB family protein n=1 Tax=unclassified Rhodococcus (in: high G+C Gram-positive bacteria) TaxID=192944 RepID=UPI001639E323|nr:MULTISPECIES: DinB family protein [unclassified Rhodococcus (in: high G+C Gram-positive bacteria)]MBC2644893.1 DinB family protein [Rhodococcus sp. 3A]MBC2890895.1 DinB family protein [Rhodococcus sp. 4CII]